jgi:hypothetical protein
MNRANASMSHGIVQTVHDGVVDVRFAPKWLALTAATRYPIAQPSWRGATTSLIRRCCISAVVHRSPRRNVMDTEHQQEA